MLFTTVEFAQFFALFMLAYACLATRAQNVLILLASYYFYGCWDWRFLLLLFASTLADYLAGRGMVAATSGRRRKAILVGVLTFNVALLGFFKYFNFFIDSLAAVVSSAGFHPNLPLLNVILPVGISFYTFQSMAYSVEVYRGRLRPERDFLLYAAYVSFFPQLVAGPIERPAHLLGQFRKPRVITWDGLSSGGLLVMIGLFKKLAIADAVAPTVEVCFSGAADATGPALLKGVWLFAIQIYCDFSGYTDIARGVARVMGFELIENFAQPYLARSITEFWRRWHISLSSWLRDYLYIPLGGNRGTTFATYRNLFLTMLIGGLWHGASWTFVVWGALHGVYLAAHKALLGERRVDPDRRWSWPVDLLKCLGTLHLVLLAWVFFRADSFAQAWNYLAGIVTWRGAADAWLIDEARPVLLYAALVLMLDVPQYLSGRHEVMLRWPWPVRGAALAGMVLLCLLLSPDDETPFIYFQF